MYSEEEKKQTLAWVKTLPREKLNKNKMVCVVIDGKVGFVPRHLL